MKQIALPLGYQNRASIFWKAGRTLTTLVQLRRSQWGNGTYVNIGALPNSFMAVGQPISEGHWGIMERASDIDVPSREYFYGIENGTNNESLPPDTFVEPCRELFAWVERNLADEESVRKVVLASDNVLTPLGPRTSKIIDWAKGQLKDPAEYDYVATRRASKWS